MSLTYKTSLYLLHFIGIYYFSLTFASLPFFSAKIPVNPLCDLGTYIETNTNKHNDDEGRRICKFEEMCEKFVDTPMILELWDNNPILIAKVTDIILRYRRRKITIWGNRFSSSIQNTCKEYDETIPIMNTTIQWFFVYLAYYSGVLPFLPTKMLTSNFDMFCVTIINEKRWGTLFVGALPNNNMKSFLKSVVEIVLTTFRFLLFCPRLFLHLQARGIPVVALVSNDTEDWGAAQNLSGIITDYPKRLWTYQNRVSGGVRGMKLSPSLIRGGSSGSVSLGIHNGQTRKRINSVNK